jgi:hypothetical protein
VIETDVEQFMTGAEYGPRKDEHMRGMIKTVGGDLLFELQYCKPDPTDDPTGRENRDRNGIRCLISKITHVSPKGVSRNKKMK